MSKTAFIFPGQGSQQPGMGKDLYEGLSDAKALFELGTRVLARDVAALCFDTPAEVLSETVNSQPAIFTVSLCAAERALALGYRPDGVCGFSLGEVTALTYAGVFSQADGFTVISERGASMQRAADKSCGGMCAVIGLEVAAVEEICRNAGGLVLPVNYNCPKQTVIAGEEDALNRAAEACLAAKALKVVRLKVNAAFHSPLMQTASEQLADAIHSVPASAATLEVYSCVTGSRMTDFSDLPGYLRTQMVSPVRFEDTVRRMIEGGYDTFVEVGTGAVLSGLMKRIDRSVKLVNVSGM